MSLPGHVIEYLQDAFAAETRPFCFLIDEHGSLVATWGDPAWCGLQDFAPGTNMLEATPYIVGILDDEPHKLNFVTTGAGVIVHLRTIPHESQHYVVLLDAGEQHDFLQQKQQSSNELRLLHRGQQRLIARQRDLISDLVEAKAELDHLRREAERSSASKSQFIAMMSHEFRTPLASIVNYADLALEDGVSDNQIHKSIEAIGRSGRHLTSLVEALLDDARLEGGHIELREKFFDLYNLLDDLAAMMAPLAAEKALSYATLVDADVPRRVRADEVRLRQILINLLGNAIKFTEEGSIRLLVTYHDGRLAAAIIDTGPGISAEDQDKVFRAFERGSQSGRAGAGLGLTITMRLAHLMGGDISLDSSPGRGCTVSVHVPVSTAPTADSRQDPALPTPDEDVCATRPTSILILDDDEDMLALIEHYLHRAGYGLIVSSSGSEAISKAVAYKPDLVILDVNIPGINGIDVALNLRRQGFDKPIVALTASTLSAAEQASFTRYFQKPAKMPALLAEVKRLTHDD